MTINNSNLLSYLVSDFTISIRDPLWGDMLFTPSLAAFYQHPQMQKLGRIKQLGPVSLLYPGAVHNRLSHSLGVCTIARKMLISLLRNGCSNLTFEGINSFLCAAMLHDIGHFPYAHSLKDVVSRSHESLAVDLIKNDKSLSKLIKEANADIDVVCSIISPEDVKAPNKETEFYQHLLSGALDPDKLDYLCRDAYYCGVPYGVQDVSYIVEHIIASDNRPALFLANAASIEHLLFSKYLMYKNVYWHRATRSATAMVKQAIIYALNDNIIKEQDLYYLDDYQFITLCNKKNYKPFELIEMAQSGHLYNTNWELSCPKNISLQVRKEITEKALKIANKRCEDYQVILDVPESISFESDILLVDSATGNVNSFKDVDELFCKSAVSSHFSSTLRKMRIYSPINEVFNV